MILRLLLVFVSLVIFAVIFSVGAWILFGASTPEFAVPDLAGMTSEQALETLRAASLVGEVQSVPGPDTAQNTVLRTYPEAASMVKPGRRVIVYVVAGEVTLTVPDLVNTMLVEAENRLSRAGIGAGAAGFRLGTVTGVLSDSPVGLILSQEPPAGTAAKAGSVVNVSVARSEGEVLMPNLENMLVKDAQDTMAALGFKVVTEPYITPAWPANTVRSQRPSPGSRLAEGVEIRLIYAVPSAETPGNAYPTPDEGKEPPVAGVEEANRGEAPSSEIPDTEAPR